MSDETKTDGNDDHKVGDDDKNEDGYTPKQQAHIDALISKKHGEAMTKAEAKYSSQMSELQGEIQGLKADLEAKTKDKGEDKDKDKDLSELRSKIDNMEAALKKSHNQTAMGNIKSIAAELGAFNSDQVATLITPFVRIEDGKTSVLNAEGQTRFSGESKDEMTVKELVKEYLDSYPHLVKASEKNGGGSKGARFDGNGEGKSITRADFSKLPPMEQQKIATGGKVVVVD